MVRFGLLKSYPIHVLLLLMGVDVHISFVSICSSGTLDTLKPRMQSVPASAATIGAAQWFLQSGYNMIPVNHMFLQESWEDYFGIFADKFPCYSPPSPMK